MRSRIAVLLGGAAVAGAAVYRALRPGRPRPEAPSAPDGPADELRAKLEEARSVASERDEFEAAEVPIDHAEEVVVDVADRRRAVHERGRRVAEHMRRPDPD
ncbi:MAG TPA: hypothetical protein VE615_02335 [Gaiellaceae bacterium]|nr:hypothetical protein [Gaiellaceae bacterium]